MSTVVDPTVVRALMSGRFLLHKGDVNFTLRNGNSTSSSVISGSQIAIQPEVYIYEPGIKTPAPAQILLSGGLLFSNVTVYTYSTVFLVAQVNLWSTLTSESVSHFFWYTPVPIAQDISGGFLKLSYPNNIVSEI